MMEMSTRVCRSCKVEKSLEDFVKNASKKLGRDSQCKVCNKEEQKFNREKPEVKEAARLRSANWRKNNPFLVIENNKQSYLVDYAKNKYKYFFKADLRKQRVKRAIPKWANLNAIFQVYELCRKTSNATGIPHEVDHIIPLQGKNVCGLHLASNLQIVTRLANRQKTNRWNEY